MEVKLPEFPVRANMAHIPREKWPSTPLYTAEQMTAYATQAAMEAVERERADWQQERNNIRAALRRICEDFGDNDWPDDLDLGDVIDKHLATWVGQAVDDETERCAQLCENRRSSEPYDPEQSMEEFAYRECAAAIRQSTKEQG